MMHISCTKCVRCTLFGDTNRTLKLCSDEPWECGVCQHPPDVGWESRCSGTAEEVLHNHTQDLSLVVETGIAY
jgi:hypothetical protein